jgi:hypothetical protein
MFITKNRYSVKVIFRVTAMVLALLLLVSCGGKAPSSKGKNDDAAKPGAAAEQDEQPGVSGSGGTASESFGAYTEAKGKVLNTLSDALSNNPGTELDSMSLLGVIMVDFLLLPASIFGQGEDAAAITLGMIGAKDIVYTENGNQYSVKYKNDEGEEYELQGVYDKAADSLKCTVFIEGDESLVSEYYKTSFGYVGQIYGINDDGSRFIYQLALSGEDGTIGISEESTTPAALTGSEAADFPKACKEWYSIEGDQFTGLTSDGRELSFVYTPSDDS